MSSLSKTSCCGVRDYHGVVALRNPVDILLDAYRKFYNHEDDNDDYDEDREWDNGAFIMFTCPVHERLLPRLKEYIDQNGLGSTMLSDSRHNTNSQQNLHVLIFGMNHVMWETWYKKDNEVLPYNVGDRVVSANTNARRFGQESTVVEIVDGMVRVDYANGDMGSGKLSDYRLVLPIRVP